MLVSAIFLGLQKWREGSGTKLLLQVARGSVELFRVTRMHADSRYRVHEMRGVYGDSRHKCNTEEEGGS